MAKDGLSEPDAHRYIQKSSMDSGTPMAAVARALIVATATSRRPVTTAPIRRSPGPAATPRRDSYPDGFARSLASRLGSLGRASRASDDRASAQRSLGPVVTVLRRPRESSRVIRMRAPPIPSHVEGTSSGLPPRALCDPTTSRAPANSHRGEESPCWADLPAAAAGQRFEHHDGRTRTGMSANFAKRR